MYVCLRVHLHFHFHFDNSFLIRKRTKVKRVLSCFLKVCRSSFISWLCYYYYFNFKFTFFVRSAQRNILVAIRFLCIHLWSLIAVHEVFICSFFSLLILHLHYESNFRSTSTTALLYGILYVYNVNVKN